MKQALTSVYLLSNCSHLLKFQIIIMMYIYIYIYIIIIYLLVRVNIADYNDIIIIDKII